MKLPSLLLFALLLGQSALAQTSSLAGGDSFAWAPSLGWINLAPGHTVPGGGVVVTDTHLFGFAWSASTGWINFGDGTPANEVRYSNTTGTDSGVNHDGAGNLRGLAWSPSIGWINFGWAAATDAHRPRFDLLTGAFTGYAWSSSAGWINLDTGLLRIASMQITDADQDGISDAWEIDMAEATSLLTSEGDYDRDGSSDLDEYLHDTNPFEPDDYLRILDYQPSATSSALTWTTRPTRLYRIARSTDLDSWLTTAIFAPDPGTQTTRTAKHDPSPRLFFKVEARIPFAP